MRRTRSVACRARPACQFAGRARGALGCGIQLGLGETGALLGALQHGQLLTQRFQALGERLTGHTERLGRTIQLAEALLQRVEILRFDVQIRSQRCAARNASSTSSAARCNASYTARA